MVVRSPEGKLLVRAGAVLFLLGLLQGVIIANFLNPRMGLSGHLAAVQSGMALMILGSLWAIPVWSRGWSVAAAWSCVIGMYGVWVALTLAAATGASGAFPIAGVGFSAEAWLELTISIMAVATGGLTILGWSAYTVGVLRKTK